MSKQSTSPVPSKKQVNIEKFNFHEAIDKLLDGKKVTKIEWGNPEFYLQMVDERLKIHKPDGKFYDLIVSTGDMQGDDYMLVS